MIAAAASIMIRGKRHQKQVCSDAAPLLQQFFSMKVDEQRL